MPRGFAIAVRVRRAAHGIGDVVHVAREGVTHEAVRAVEIPVGVTHPGQGRGRSGHIVAVGAGRLAGLVAGLEGARAVGIASPAHGVGDVVEITGVACSEVYAGGRSA